MLNANEDKESFLIDSLWKETLDVLDWDVLKKQIATFASTKYGEKAIIELEVPKNIEESLELLGETQEINKLESDLNVKISFAGFTQIKDKVDICMKDGVITSNDLLEILETLSCARKLKKIIFNPQLCPYLSSLANRLVDHANLEKLLKNSIEPNGRISDNASEKLRELRIKLNLVKNERRLLLDTFIRTHTKYIQDSTVGDRLDRPVLAIKVNYIEKLKGIIHDSSSSGNTVFFEPEIVVSKGNQIASLKAKILKEEFKLLKKLSKDISENGESLINKSDILLRLEKALTRSRYSNFIQGNPPHFENHVNINIEGFRHPLLIWEKVHGEAREPTPIDFFTDRNTKVIAITGPNTGGKTAALKGLGIAILMARSGFYIPSSSPPIIPFFLNIYADIGDDQSLEGDLSTFSGHIQRIRKILQALDNKKGLSLVLLDEIGSGTDPVEGTALAIALLNEFADKSDLTMATTHYGELKVLKYKDTRFENVSVHFDEETLKPKYQLNWGIPGRSNALSISKRIGISSEIINEAKKYLQPKEIENINLIIKGLEEQKIKQQNSAEEAAALIARTEILYEDLKRNYEHQKTNAEKFQALERKKLTKMINEAKSEVVDLIKKLRNKSANGEDARRVGIRLKEIEKELITKKKVTKKLSWKPNVGDLVKIKSLHTKGRIIDCYEKGLSFKVKYGNFTSVLSISDIEGMNGEKPEFSKLPIEVKSVADNYSFSKVRTSKNSLDVRGMRVHEAEIVVEEKIRKFHGPLWIIHGIGTGKLKKGLRSWLEQLDYVVNIEDASPSEGGAGCSIVWIK